MKNPIECPPDRFVAILRAQENIGTIWADRKGSTYRSHPETGQLTYCSIIDFYAYVSGLLYKCTELPWELDESKVVAELGLQYKPPGIEMRADWSAS